MQRWDRESLQPVAVPCTSLMFKLFRLFLMLDVQYLVSRTVTPLCYLVSSLLCEIFRRDASICIARISYGNVSVWVAGWVAGWLSVTAGIVSK